jgi:hypothetical protein
MRRVLYVLGSLFLAIIAIGALAIGYAACNGQALDAESKAYVDAAIPAITSNWSEAELMNRATPELRASTSPEEVDQLFQTFSRVGHLVVYKGSSGQSLMSYVAGTGKTISASYVAKASFQNGDATIRIGLLKRSGQWLISNFNVRFDSAVAARLRQMST